MGACRNYHACPSWSRREWLRLGATWLSGLSLPRLLAAESVSSANASLRSLILLNCFGGPSHLDTWDMKPQGPSAIRGSFAAISTSNPGECVCEHLPGLARIAKHLTLVRSVTHDRNVHGGAVGFALTGTRTADPGIPGVRGPDASPEDFPAIGSTVTRLAPGRDDLPTAVTLPWDLIDGQGRFVPGQTGGMLGRQYDPWFVRSDPNADDFRVDGLAPPPGVTLERMDVRRGLRRSLIEKQRRMAETAATRHLDAYYSQAFDLLTSEATRIAFRLSDETPALRERYGRNTLGQSCLLARRLVEAGVRVVQVNASGSLFGDYGWDTHGDNFNTLKHKLLPRFDPAFSMLIDDLHARGRLDDTLVVCLGEFGRTPKISANAGREHWPQCYTVLFAGAGMKPGFVYGRSDVQGAYPVESPVTPEDIVATIYDTLGVPPHTMLRDAAGREHPLVRGRVLTELRA